MAAAPSQPAVLPLPPAVPAQVRYDHGVLTVEASDSELAEIVGQVARLTGMSVSGLGDGPRVYGVYGPGDARSVLAELLTGSGYNFLMVGGNAAPRELVLTPEKPAPPAVAKVAEPEQPPDEEYDDVVIEQSSNPEYTQQSPNPDRP